MSFFLEVSMQTPNIISVIGPIPWHTRLVCETMMPQVETKSFKIKVTVKVRRSSTMVSFVKVSLVDYACQNMKYKISHCLKLLSRLKFMSSFCFFLLFFFFWGGGQSHRQANCMSRFPFLHMYCYEMRKAHIFDRHQNENTVYSFHPISNRRSYTVRTHLKVFRKVH